MCQLLRYINTTQLIGTLLHWHIIIIRNILKKHITLLLIIHLATIMLHSITHYQIIDF